jgi:hypothetical protein
MQKIMAARGSSTRRRIRNQGLFHKHTEQGAAYTFRKYWWLLSPNGDIVKLGDAKQNLAELEPQIETSEANSTEVCGGAAGTSSINSG